MKLTVDLKGAKELRDSISALAGTVHGSLATAVRVQGIKLQRHVVQDKLSGSPLHRRSGDLSRSVYFTTEDDGMTGVVGANAPYASYQEYGFQGTVTVKSFVRRTRAQMATAKRNVLGHETRASLAKGVGTGETTVRSFSRTVNYPAHSYLRSALDDYRADIIDALHVAVVRGLAL